MTIKEFLFNAGVYPNLSGFNYLIRAVEIVKEKGKIPIKKGIYEQIANEYGTSANCVEKAIVTVIKKIKTDDFKRIGVNSRLTTGQFIYFLAFMEG